MSFSQLHVGNFFCQNSDKGSYSISGSPVPLCSVCRPLNLQSLSALLGERHRVRPGRKAHIVTIFENLWKLSKCCQICDNGWHSRSGSPAADVQPPSSPGCERPERRGLGGERHTSLRVFRDNSRARLRTREATSSRRRDTGNRREGVN